MDTTCALPRVLAHTVGWAVGSTASASSPTARSRQLGTTRPGQANARGPTPTLTAHTRSSGCARAALSNSSSHIIIRGAAAMPSRPLTCRAPPHARRTWLARPSSRHPHAAGGSTPAASTTAGKTGAGSWRPLRSTAGPPNCHCKLACTRTTRPATVCCRTACAALGPPPPPPPPESANHTITPPPG